jgi:hypothetical protein
MLVAEVAASPSTTSLPLTKPWASIPVRIVRRYNKPATLALTRGVVLKPHPLQRCSYPCLLMRNHAADGGGA